MKTVSKREKVSLPGIPVLRNVFWCRIWPRTSTASSYLLSVDTAEIIVKPAYMFTPRSSNSAPIHTALVRSPATLQSCKR